MAISSVAAALAGCHPAGWAPADAALAAGAAAVVTWASARARTWARLVLAVVALAAGTGWAVAAALAAIALAVVASDVEPRRRRLARVLGAAAGGIAFNVLLRLPQLTLATHWQWASAPTGSTALVTLLACAPVLCTAWSASNHVVRRRFRLAAAGLGIFVLVSLAGFGAAALVGRGDMGRGIYSAQHGLDAAERGNPAGAASELEISAAAFARARRDFDAPWTWPAHLLPVIGQYANAASELARAGYTVAAPSSRAAREVPYEELTAEPGRVDLTLLRSIEDPVARADAALREASRIVDGVDTSWLPAPLTSRLERYRYHLESNVPEADRALEAVRLTPDLLGASGIRHYLVLFGNPAESRMLGGYGGAYGELTADDGPPLLEPLGPHRGPARCQCGGRRIVEPPGVAGSAVHAGAAPRQRHQLTGLPCRRQGRPPTCSAARSACTSTACCTSIRRVWPPCSGWSAASAFAGLDQPLTELNLAKFLLQDQYRSFSVRSERFDFLSATARATFHLLTTRSLPSPVKLFEQLAPAVAGDHLKLWFADPATRRLLDEVGVSGRPHRDPADDLFDLRTSNISQNKTDAFLTRTVDYQSERDPSTGGVDADVTIELHNGAPPASPTTC